MTNEELVQTHPDYKTYLPEWEFFVNSYLGGKFYRDGNYLVQHPYESDDNYIRRKKIAYFYNYCSPIVDIFTSYLTQKQPKRNYGSLASETAPPRMPKTLFDSFWWDIDFEGTNLEQFMREAERYASIYGKVSIIVDKPAMGVETQAEAIENDIRPYCTMITPENLLDWKYVRLSNGKPVLDMIKVREDVDIFRIWTRTEWELWQVTEGDKAPLMTDSGFHDLGEVPMVTLYNKKSGIRQVGISDIQDIADINKNIYHFCSDAKEIIENTAFPMLAMPFEKGGGGDGSPVVVGPKSIIDFDPELANGKPEWLEPPHTSLEEIRAWIQQDAQEMVRIAKMGGMRNTEMSTQPWSGVSIEMQERQLYSSLAEKSTNAEQAELDIFRLYALWEGIDFDGTIEYPRDFAIRDMAIALNNAIAAGTAKINSLTFEKERQKKIINATLPNIKEADRDKIYEEINALDKLWWRKTVIEDNPVLAAATNQGGNQGVTNV